MRSDHKLIKNLPFTWQLFVFRRSYFKLSVTLLNITEVGKVSCSYIQKGNRWEAVGEHVRSIGYTWLEPEADPRLAGSLLAHRSLTGYDFGLKHHNGLTIFHKSKSEITLTKNCRKMLATSLLKNIDIEHVLKVIDFLW